MAESDDMDDQEAEIVYWSQDSEDKCSEEIKDYDLYCQHICGKEFSQCNQCDVPMIIAQLKKRRIDLEKSRKLQ